MATLAVYGNVQPSEYRGMPRSHAAELVKKVRELRAEDHKMMLDFQSALTKAVIETMVGGFSGLAKTIAKRGI